MQTARVCLHIASVCLSIVAGNSQVADLCVGDEPSKPVLKFIDRILKTRIWRLANFLLADCV